MILWLREEDLNIRPTGYELRPVRQTAAPQCFPGLFGPEIPKNPKVVPFRSAGFFDILGHILGQDLKGQDQQKLRRSKEYSRPSENGVKHPGSSVGPRAQKPILAACEGLCGALTERVASGTLRRLQAVCGLRARLESGDGCSPAGPLRAEVSRF